jgi:PII-like signaling protein
MRGSLLRFYVHEKDRIDGEPAWQWLLREANQLNLPGGSAFRAMAGFGRHHVLRANHFFELAGTQAIEVEFIATDEDAHALTARVRDKQADMFFVRMPVEFGRLARGPEGEIGSGVG